MSRLRQTLLVLVAGATLLLAGVTRAADPPGTAPPAPRAVVEALRLDAEREDRILALDPDRITEKDVRETLAGTPAPRMFLLHGGVFPVHLIMWSFAHFLNGMGYPEEALRDPATTEWSYTPYDTTDRLVGMIAWAYEHEGMRPMMVGHSQGGLFALKILKRLAGQMGDSAQVYDPLKREYLARTTITDPLTGKERPVIGLSVSYASAVGAGGYALLLPAWWESLDTLRKVPDTVSEFTGFFVDGDLIALSFSGNPLDKPYEATGTAQVRNVRLPVNYNHITVPDTEDLAADPAARAWIYAYEPGVGRDTAELSFSAQNHIIWAAEQWYSIRKHWCIELQRLIRAKRAAVALARPAG